MAREISIPDFRPSSSRDQWVSSSKLQDIIETAPADPDLLDDLADVRGAELDD
jgi:hypothetical protein